MSPLQRFADANWRLVPVRLHRPLERWLADGIVPTSPFLYAVLRNDLVLAIEVASPAERAGLVDLVLFLVNDCPPQSFGSLANVFAWAELGGWRGMRDAPDKTDIYEQRPWRGQLWKPGKEDDDE